MLDIHSHILPGVDDGAKSLEDSIKILEMMKSQGITDVVATPHFYPNSDSLEYYLHTSHDAYNQLLTAVKGKSLPNIYLGCEILYYPNIGTGESVKYFSLAQTRYLLLELTDNSINSKLFEDIINLRSNLGLIPIIAHIERYFKSRNYKKLLNFVREERILSQINASSLFTKYYQGTAKKLIKNGIPVFLATDSHSPDTRPPEMKRALEFIEKKYGKEKAEMFVKNSNKILTEIARRNA